MSDAGGLILVVEDSVINRKLLDRALHTEGHETLAVIRDRPIDVVLLDLIMPGLDGFAVLERIKSDPLLVAPESQDTRGDELVLHVGT